MPTAVSLWDKIDISAQSIDTSSDEKGDRDTSNVTTDRAQKQRQLRRWIRLCDTVAVVSWTFLAVKVFIFDWDHWLFVELFPALSFVSAYRFFVFLAAIVIIVALIRRSFLIFAYISLFPLVVLAWKIPRWLIQIGSWNVVLGVVSLFYTTLHGIRKHFVLRGIELFAILGVFVSDSIYILAPCAISIGAALAYRYGKAAIGAIGASRFLEKQKDIVSRYVKWEFLHEMATVPPDLKDASLVKFNESQLQIFAAKVSFGVCAWKMLDFYTALLNRYRRSTAPLVLGILTFIGLFLQSLVYLSIINFAIWKTVPAQFGESDLSFVDFVYYSITSLYGNTVPTVTATGTIAKIVAIISAVYGPVLLLTLAVQLWFGFKQSRDDTAFVELTRKVREHREDLDARLSDNYEVSVEEAWRKMEELSLGFVSIASFLAKRMPSAPAEE